MTRTRSWLQSAGLVGLALAALSAAPAADPPPQQAAPPPAPKAAFPTKAKVEIPVKTLLAATAPNPPAPGGFRDVGKTLVEAPTEALLAVTATNPPAPQPGIVPDFSKTVVIERPTKALLAATVGNTAVPAKDAFVNPKVQPGKVKWHADFATACKAAGKSHKPVLLFQMMGKLDDQFC
jgi:hypothetical protein